VDCRSYRFYHERDFQPRNTRKKRFLNVFSQEVREQFLDNICHETSQGHFGVDCRSDNFGIGRIDTPNRHKQRLPLIPPLCGIGLWRECQLIVTDQGMHLPQEDP
jgi:hypothetical protein